jgi:hypothetical protein
MAMNNGSGKSSGTLQSPASAGGSLSSGGASGNLPVPDRLLAHAAGLVSANAASQVQPEVISAAAIETPIVVAQATSSQGIAAIPSGVTGKVAGTITVIVGDVKIIGADGVVRIAQVGDKVFFNETLVTGADGMVHVQLTNGHVVDLGFDSKLALDADVLGPDGGNAAAAAAAPGQDVAALQAAIASGADPTQVAQATAAGGAPGTGGADSGGSHEPVVLDQANTTGPVTSGFETGPASITFPTPEEAPLLNQPPLVSVGVQVTVDNSVQTGVSAASLIEGTGEGTKVVNFAITLDHAFITDVQVTYQILAGTASTPSDFAGVLTGTTVNIPAGQTQIIVSVDIVQDSFVESNETFSIVLTDAVNASINPAANSAVVTIIDDDSVSFAVSVSDAQTELAGTAVSISEENLADNAATFTVAMSGGVLEAGSSASVVLSFPGTASDGVDYTAAIESAIATAVGSGISYNAATNTLTFTGGGATSISFTVTAVNDDALDSGETIQVQLDSTSITQGATPTITQALATATITDIDQSISAVSVDDEGAEAAGTAVSISEENLTDNAATFTVSISGALNTGNTASVVLDFPGTASDGVDYTSAIETAIAAATGSGISYNAATNTLIFTGGGATSISFTLTAVNDDLLDSGETIQVHLSGATVDEGTASITTALATATITDIDVAVTFGITVTSEATGNDTPTQLAVVSEENLADNTGTFTITKTGVLTDDNTASVTLTMSGTASNADFSAAVIQAIADAASLAGTAVSGQTATSLTLTWSAGDPGSFNVDLTTVNDVAIEGTESLTLTLSAPTVIEGGAALDGTQSAATLTVDEFEPRILDGVMKTNSNVTNQFITLTFAEVNDPLHSAAKIYDLFLQGQQGSVVQDVGFNIDPAKQYQVTVEAASGTKAILTDFSLEGVTIQGSGNAQLEKDDTSSTSSDSMAITSIIDPQTALVQAVTQSTDGDAGVNTLTDVTSTTVNYLYGASGNDTLNGSSGSDVLNGGPGIDTLNGNDGNDILVYDGASNDIINGGAGFDLLRVDDGALALSIAGSANDANTLNSANNFPVDLTGRSISNIEGILITEGAGTSTTSTDPNDDVGTSIVLNAQDVLDYSSTDTLYILGSPGDKVELPATQGWDADVTQATDPQGQTFVLYTATVGSETARLLVETDVQVHIA